MYRIRYVELYWKRGFTEKWHKIPGKVTAKQAREIEKAINIAGWFMDVETKRKS